MKSRLIYEGDSPVHVLSDSWNKGKFKTLDQLFAVWGEKSPFNDASEEFADWFCQTYLKNLGSDWVFIKSEEDFIDSIELDDDTQEDRSGHVNIESSALEASSSREEAEERLKKMRHPETVGTIQRSNVDSTEYKDKLSLAKNFPEAGTKVMTGDDLDKSNAMKGSIVDEQYSSALVLDIGEKTSELAAKEAQVVNERIKQMSNANHRSKVLNPEDLRSDGSRVQVVTGDSFGVSIKASSDNPNLAEESKPKKVNESFKAYSDSSNVKKISVNDIVNAPSSRKAKELINKCRDTRLLKIARNSCYNQGKTALFEEINNRLRHLPSSSM